MNEDRSPRPAPRLEVRGVSKGFPGVRALVDVSLEVAPGEVVALIGENGAGKSTLMKILAGIHRPDTGEIRVDGRAVRLGTPREAADVGVALIHQELNLATNLDAGANVFLGREPSRGGRLDRGAIARRAGELLRSIGATFGPGAATAALSVGQQQQIEIAKALAIEARLVIMDEPTSSLSARETADLFRIVGELSDRGVSVIYISHRLGEVRALAHRVVVLRDGRNAGELPRERIEHDAMVRLMVGRDVHLADRPSSRREGVPALEVRGLRTARHPGEAIDLSVHPGEVVGIAGLVGAGRTEVLRAIFGVEARVAGEVRVADQPIEPNPVAAIAAGLGLVPEDRKELGLFLEWGVPENVSVAVLRRFATRSRVDRGRESRMAADLCARLGVKAGPRQVVGVLSGGNQQKVVLAKWLAGAPRVLLLDEPTRGIDVGARQEIYGHLEALAADGVAVLFVSSEMEEVLALPDRVLVMHEGRLAGELARAELSEEAVMRLATGATGATGAEEAVTA